MLSLHSHIQIDNDRKNWVLEIEEKELAKFY